MRLATKKEIANPLLLLNDGTQQSFDTIFAETCYLLKFIHYHDHVTLTLCQLLRDIEHLGKGIWGDMAFGKVYRQFWRSVNTEFECRPDSFYPLGQVLCEVLYLCQFPLGRINH